MTGIRDKNLLSLSLSRFFFGQTKNLNQSREKLSRALTAEKVLLSFFLHFLSSSFPIVLFVRRDCVEEKNGQRELLLRFRFSSPKFGNITCSAKIPNEISFRNKGPSPEYTSSIFLSPLLQFK